MDRRLIWMAALAVAVMGVAIPRAHAADPACTDTMNLPNPVFMSIGDTQVNLIKALGKQLRDAENVTLIWRATGSCTNLDTLYTKANLSGTLSYIPANFDPKATPPTCTLAMPGVPADMANSIVFLEGCPSMKPAAVTDVLGPVQSFVFVVPTASGQSAITAEEAYFTFGFGQSGMVTPWTDEKQLFIRPVTKGTIISMAASIKVPAGKWKGMSIDMSKDVANQVAMAINPQTALGILGSEVYDQYRASLKALAFRAFGQYHAYFPDSASSGFDRRNVRDGHYHMWSYTHWLYWTDGQGKALNPLARRVADLIAGNAVMPAPTFETADTIQKVGLVPICAMKVQRTVEGGDFTPFSPDAPCGCYFDQLVTGKTNCTACTDDTPCQGGKCRRGYCEAK